MKDTSTRDVDADLNSFIEKRAAQREREEGRQGDRKRESSYARSVREHAEREQRENIAAWYDYHLSMADAAEANLDRLVTYHKGEAERCRKMLTGRAPRPPLRVWLAPGAGEVA